MTHTQSLLPFALTTMLLTAAPPARGEPVAVGPEARVVELEATLADANEDLRRERLKVNGLSGKAIDLEEQLRAALARIQELETALSTLREELERTEVELKTEKRLASERIADRDKRIAELEAVLAQLRERNASLQVTIEATKGALAELEKRKAAADARIAEFKALIDKFRALIDAGRLRVKIVEGRMVVELATDILFGSGSATLSRGGRDAIKEVTSILATIPDRKFQIEGHTDDVPIATATFPSNWELASARAITVVKTMLQHGMPVERISAASYADVRPAVANDSKEGRAANRRIEIVVVPDLSTLPGFEELNQVAGTPAP